MIRLNHQFDDPRARPTVASPTVGGCCCCCCCCVVTAVSTCVLTSRAVGRGIDRIAEHALTEPASETVPVAQPNFREPAAIDVPIAPTRVPNKLPWMVLGFVLPVAPWVVASLAFAAFSVFSWEIRNRIEWLSWVIGVGTYLGLAGLLYKRAGLRPLFIVLMPVLWAVVSVGEAWIWIECMK